MSTQTTPNGSIVTYDPNGLWKIWDINEIYTGVVASNKYVPKVRDHVVNPITDQKYLVSAVDPLTLVPTLTEIGTNSDSDGELLSSGVGANPDTYRVYLDTTVVPFSLAVDARLKIHSSEASYAKIFKGSDTTATGRVISMLYDQQGTFLTHNIPMTLVAMNSHDNHAIKAVPVCYTNDQLANGERVTVVVYTAEGGEISRQPCWVNISSFVASLEADTRYVSHISLKSPFLSPTVESTINYPINIPLQSMNMFGVVHYSDGSSVELPVDGAKFSILGLERFVGTYPGQHVPLTLRYKLDSNEVAYGQMVSADGKYISEPYDMVTTEQVGAFTVKLAGYPMWRADLEEYQMRWYMSDLNRNIMFDVTPYVYYNASSDNFNGRTYGAIQRLSIRINLKDVSQAFPSYIHTQTLSVTLKNAGTVAGSNWKVAFENNQEPLFGETLYAMRSMINQNLWRVNVRAGIPNFADWLNRFFYDSKPLFAQGRESRAPEPTHMVFFIGATRSEVPITYWNQEFNLSLNLGSQTNLQIEFINRTSGGDLRLGVVAVPLHTVV